jgi:Putative peptidoglycan binding domain
MRIALTVITCLALGPFAAAKQDNDQNQNKKKGGGGNAPQQQHVVAPQPGKKFKTGPGAGAQNFQQSNTGGQFKHGNLGPNATNLNSSKSNKFKASGQTGGQLNTSSNAANTTFNKTKFGAQGNVGGGGNAKFQKQKFNLQTNNKQVVINKYKTVNFNQNYRIAGAHNWKGPKYAVFVNYHPLWQPQWWWTSHYNHIVFIYGGWYYWNANYWYPAWGYAPDSVYAYDGPIYASSPDYDPAQVVANVQSALQQQGYYQGDIDGVLGPQTRAALAEYQSAQGIEPTGLVDEPTLETLGMS